MHVGIKFLGFGKPHMEFLCDRTGCRVDSVVFVGVTGGGEAWGVGRLPISLVTELGKLLGGK